MTPARRRHAATRSAEPLTLATHLVWSALAAAAAALLIGAELATGCPPGGLLSFGDCDDVRPFAIGVVGLSALLYVGGLTAIRSWTTGLVRRGVADRRAARDWYLLAAATGLAIAPMLAFTLASAVR